MHASNKAIHVLEREASHSNGGLSFHLYTLFTANFVYLFYGIYTQLQLRINQDYPN